MSLCFIISLFTAQHVSDVNTSICGSLRLICWVISWVVLLWFDVCWCYGVVWLGWCGIRMQAESLQHGQHGRHSKPTSPKLQNTSNQEHTTNVVIQQHSRKLLMMDIFMSETCWAAHKKWNKIASDIKLVFYSSKLSDLFVNTNVDNTVIFFKNWVGEKHLRINFLHQNSHIIWFKIHFLNLWGHP